MQEIHGEIANSRDGYRGDHRRQEIHQLLVPSISDISRNQTDIHKIAKPVIQHISGQQALHPPNQKAGYYKGRPQNPLNQGPVEHRLAFPDRSDRLGIDSLQALGQADQAEHLEIRYTRQPSVRVKQNKDWPRRQHQDEHDREGQE